MRLAIAVHGSPVNVQAARSALRFAEAAIAADHELLRVFFYHDGVYNGSALTVAPQDEEDLTASWARLGSEHGVELLVCIASALKRGVLDAGEAQRYQRSAANLRPEFELAGLGQLIDASINADRLITFGV